MEGLEAEAARAKVGVVRDQAAASKALVTAAAAAAEVEVGEAVEEDWVTPREAAAGAVAVAEREATEAAADRAEKEVEAASSHHTLRSLGCRTRLVARAQRRRAFGHTAASTQTCSAAHRGDQTRRNGRARPSPSAPDTLPHPSAGTACPCRRRRPCISLIQY